MNHLPFDLDAPRITALLLIFACWSLYGPILRRLGRGTLNAQLHVVRLRWMRMMLDSQRENRVFDGILLGQLSSSMSFFGSGTLLVVAGLVGTLANVGAVHGALTRMEFVPPISQALFTVYFAGLTLIMAVSFFSFVYALRKLAYTLAMIGGLTEAKISNAHSQVMIAQTAAVLTASVMSLNNGIRGFYFAVAALFLFVGPYVAMFMTLMITGVLIYRQGFSSEALAIERYVDAMNRYEEERIAKGENAI
jgi:uncharacterized membrane protein